MVNKPQLNVCLTPALIPCYSLHDTLVVVIDIFRATSTICAALDNGAQAVIPVATVKECLKLETEQPHIITAGERDGRIIEGLQGGNSPLEYTSDVIKGKILALTTTNGTRLLHMVKDAEQVLIGSFLNKDALCDYILYSKKNVLLACGGWRDKINLEDTLFAGSVISCIGDAFDINCDGAFLAQSLYKQALEETSIFDFLKLGTHYHRLSHYHLEKDMIYCCQPNLHPVVPLFKAPYLII